MKFGVAGIGASNIRLEEQKKAIQFIKKEAEHFELAFKAKGLRFNIINEEERIEASVDKDMIGKIIFNLLSNALKYTQNGEVSIVLSKLQSNQIQELKEILVLSPSSINSQPWKFTIIPRGEVKNQLAEHSYFNAEKVKDASHVVVFSVVNDISYFENQINKHLHEGAINY